MDSIPVCFVESLVRISRREELQQLQHLSGHWRLSAEVQWRKSGRLELAYLPLNPNHWMFWYRIKGFDHLGTETLSREVLREMSKSITSIEFLITEKLAVGRDWNIAPNRSDDVLQLIGRLDAPEKKLCVSAGSLEWHEKLFPKYAQLLKSFTSLRLESFPLFMMQFFKDMVATGRLRSIFFCEPIPAYQLYDMDFWVDYFLSESCTRLTADFKDFAVVLEIIKRWKKADLHGFTASKVLRGIEASPEAFTGMGMKPMPMDLLGSDLLKLIERKITGFWNIKSLHCIDHSEDPSGRIYVVFLGWGSCALLFQ
uniref:F-box domain-containing protein n=1 Tax=Steinernema glaseri TaxID=37863 RepID=A0A1I7ZYJ8_9BILA